MEHLLKPQSILEVNQPVIAVPKALLIAITLQSIPSLTATQVGIVQEKNTLMTITYICFLLLIALMIYRYVQDYNPLLGTMLLA